MAPTGPRRRRIESRWLDRPSAEDGDAKIITRELEVALRAAQFHDRRVMFTGRLWERLCDIETSSARYVVLRQPHQPTGGLRPLTERERQVVRLSADGNSPKEIAYELGVSHSTVRVLLMRAAQKYGVRTRSELIAKLAAP